MKYVNTHEAKSQLSKLIAAVRDGEEVVICQAGKPVARLMAFEGERKVPQFGIWEGKVISSQVGIRQKPTPRSRKCSRFDQRARAKVRLLIDSHAALGPQQSEQLSTNARSALGDPANERFVSVAALWEIAIKVSVGKLSIPMTLDAA